MEQQEFKTGQKTYSPLWEGPRELKFTGNPTYPWEVKNPRYVFTTDGRLERGRPILLFHNPLEIIERGWPLREGELCWFWDHDDISKEVAVCKKAGSMPNFDCDEFKWDYYSPFSKIPEHLAELAKEAQENDEEG